MRRLLRTIGIVTALALPGTVFAQGGYVQGNIGVHEGYGMHQGYGFNQQTGMVHGRVLRTNLPAGLLLLQTRQGVVRVSASPSQLAGINQGDRVRFPIVNYAGAIWLSPTVGQYRFMGNYGQEQRFEGRIQSIDLARGVIYVNGEGFRVNPAELQNVMQGELVSLRVVSIGHTQWISRIHRLRGGFR